MIEDKKYKFENSVLYLKKTDGGLEEVFKDDGWEGNPYESKYLVGVI